MRTTGRTKLLCAFALAALGTCIFAATAFGAPPSNDMFASPQVLSGAQGSVTGTNIDATKEPGEPNHAGNPGGASVWYIWEADFAGTVTISTFGSDFDTLLAVYTGGNLSTVTQVAASDDAVPPAGWSSVTFNTQTGRNYRIAVDGWNGATGNITLNWNLNPSSPVPSNDNFANAQTINGFCTTVTGTNLAATKEDGEPDHAGNPGGASVWYVWTAPASGTATVSTEGSDFDTLLGVYTGSSVDSLTPVASNDDVNPPGDVTSALTFTAVAGTKYYIAVDGFFGPSHGLHEGHIVLNVCGPPPPCKQKMNVQWHYRSHGTSGSWSATVTPNCQTGAISIGPSTMEGDLKVSPGQSVDFGYRFNVSAPATVVVKNIKVVFTIRCASGRTPTQSTYTATVADATYNVTKSGWNPSNDQKSPLVWQGTFSMPDFCNGGQVRLDKGGKFTANMFVF